MQHKTRFKSDEARALDAYQWLCENGLDLISPAVAYRFWSPLSQTGSVSKRMLVQGSTSPGLDYNSGKG